MTLYNEMFTVVSFCGANFLEAHCRACERAENLVHRTSATCSIFTASIVLPPIGQRLMKQLVCICSESYRNTLAAGVAWLLIQKGTKDLMIIIMYPCAVFT